MTRDEIKQIALDSGWSGLYITWAEPNGKSDWSPYKESLTVPVTIEQVERFANLVEQRTRGECVRICDNLWDMSGDRCAEAIHATMSKDKP